MTNKNYLPQVDIVKGLAIIAILLLHFLTETSRDPATGLLSSLRAIQPVFDLAVPAFILLMGFNMARAFALKPRSHRHYFAGRAKRVLPAFAIVFLASLALGIILKIPLDFGERQFVGFFPVPGAGNYFIPLVFQFIILFPLLFGIYKKNKLGSFFAMFGLDLIFEAGFVLGIVPIQIVYQYCIARFLVLIWVGFFLAEKAKKRIKFGSITSQLVPLNYLGLLGKASYHIFLVQILAFSAIGTALGLNPLIKVLFSIAVGLGFYYANSLALKTAVKK